MFAWPILQTTLLLFCLLLIKDMINGVFIVYKLMYFAVLIISILLR
jgi:hypothetical protein